MTTLVYIKCSAAGATMSTVVYTRPHVLRPMPTESTPNDDLPTTRSKIKLMDVLHERCYCQHSNVSIAAVPATATATTHPRRPPQRLSRLRTRRRRCYCR